MYYYTLVPGGSFFPFSVQLVMYTPEFLPNVPRQYTPEIYRASLVQTDGDASTSAIDIFLGSKVYPGSNTLLPRH